PTLSQKGDQYMQHSDSGRRLTSAIAYQPNSLSIGSGKLPPKIANTNRPNRERLLQVRPAQWRRNAPPIRDIYIGFGSLADIRERITRCPHYAREQKCSASASMSAKCHKQT